MVEKFDKWLVFEKGKKSNYSFGVTLESTPEADCEALNKNAGCLQWRREKGFLRL
jgi:hypothetical protein